MTDKAKPFLTSGRVVYGSPTNTWTAPWFAMVADSLGKTSAADLDAAVQRLASVPVLEAEVERLRADVSELLSANTELCGIEARLHDVGEGFLRRAEAAEARVAELEAEIARRDTINQRWGLTGYFALTTKEPEQ